MRKALLIGGGVAVAAALAAGVYFFLNKTAPLDSGPEALVGLLTAVSEDGFTITLLNGSDRSFILDPQTRFYSYVAEGERSPLLTEIPEGALLSVLLSEDGSVWQVQVVPPSPAPEFGESFFGTVDEVTVSSFTVSLADRKGRRTILVTNSTKIISATLAGQEGKGFADLRKGLGVSVWGEEKALLISIGFPTEETR